MRVKRAPAIFSPSLLIASLLCDNSASSASSASSAFLCVSAYLFSLPYSNPADKPPRVQRAPRIKLLLHRAHQGQRVASIPPRVESCYAPGLWAITSEPRHVLDSHEILAARSQSPKLPLQSAPIRPGRLRNNVPTQLPNDNVAIVSNVSAIRAGKVANFATANSALPFFSAEQIACRALHTSLPVSVIVAEPIIDFTCSHLHSQSACVPSNKTFHARFRPWFAANLQRRMRQLRILNRQHQPLRLPHIRRHA